MKKFFSFVSLFFLCLVSMQTHIAAMGLPATAMEFQMQETSDDEKDISEINVEVKEKLQKLFTDISLEEFKVLLDFAKQNGFLEYALLTMRDDCFERPLLHYIIRKISWPGDSSLRQEKVKTLLSYSANLSIAEYVPPKLLEKVLKLKDDFGNTLLHVAVDNGTLETIETILRYAQQLDIVDFMFRRNDDGWTALHRARIRNVAVIEFLQKYVKKCEIEGSLEQTKIASHM